MIGARLFLLLAALLAGLPMAAAESLRVAAYTVDLARDGPGLLLHDLGQAPKPPLAAVIAVIRTVRPDVLLLCGFDHDLRSKALMAFLDRLREGPQGIDYPFYFDAAVNAGVDSGLDLDGDGRRLGWDDALGWGRFPGNGGMALVSRHPLDEAAARSFRGLRWEDLPGAQLPVRADGTPFPSAEARAVLPLASRSLWDVPLVLPGGVVHVLAVCATPPLHDGPERLNARRNNDEIAFWSQYLDGAAFRDDQGRTGAAPNAPLVVLGNLNADPLEGAGLRDGLRRLLTHERLLDPAPVSEGGAAAGGRKRGSPALDTAVFPGKAGVRGLRLDYVLPSRDLGVKGSGVFWPEDGAPLAEAVAAGPAHRLVWVDLDLP